MTCDVIGHDVMVEPVIPNERPGTELYGSEVSWAKREWITTNSRFISAKSCYFKVKNLKKPNNPRGRANDGTLKFRHMV